MVAGLLLATGCAPASRTAEPAATGSPRPSNPPLETVEVAFDGGAVTAEIADEHPERLLGLMNRRSLDHDAGMLFVFPAKSSGGFWMKNTLIPLSIAYMGRAGDDAFEVLAILDMDPCTEPSCPSYPPGVPYDAALEVNQGWFAEAGVQVGDVATLDRTVEAQTS